MRICALSLLLAPWGCTFGAAGSSGSAGVVADGSTGAADEGSGDAAEDPLPLPDSSGESSGDSPISTSTGAGGDSSGAATSASDTAGTTTEDGTTSSPPTCTSALLVTGNLDPTTSGDAPFYERLVALGYDITVVGNADSEAEDAEGHCLVLLSALGSASDVEDEFRDVAVPIVTWEYALYDNMRMVDPGDSSAWGIADPQDDVVIVDAAHPLAGGAAGTVSIFSGGGRVAWGVPAGSAQVVATLPGMPTRATLFGFEAGAAMAEGFVAPARRVGYPHGETPITTTDAAVDLFEAAVQWAVQ